MQHRPSMHGPVPLKSGIHVKICTQNTDLERVLTQKGYAVSLALLPFMYARQLSCNPCY